MRNVAIVSANGIVVGTRGGDALPDPDVDTSYADYDPRSLPDPRGMRYANGGFVAVAMSLEAYQRQRWAEAKAYRTARRAAGCDTAKGRVQTDDVSRDAIAQAALDATVNQVAVPGWSIVWTMADNSQKPHTAVEMIAMASKVRAYVTGCQTASQAVRTKIFSAATVASVAAVDITAGYPT